MRYSHNLRNVLILLAFCLMPASGLGAVLEAKVGLGGGSTLGLAENTSGFSLDLSAGLGFELDGGGAWMLKPQVGGTFDFYDDTHFWFFSGGMLSFAPVEDSLSLSLQTGLVTDFDRAGLRGAFRVAVLADILTLELQVDGYFDEGPDFAIIRGLAGVDVGALFVFGMRMARL